MLSQSHTTDGPTPVAGITPAIEDDRLDGLCQQHSLVMLLIDPDSGAIIDANPAAAAFYGWDVVTLRAMNIADINRLAPEELELRRAQAYTGSESTFRFEHQCADGSVHRMEVHSAPVDTGVRSLLFSILVPLD